jgi:hypothetical protein
MTTVKCMLNSIVSDDDGDHCTIDIKDFYLNTTLDDSEYMWMNLRTIPHEYRIKLGLTQLQPNNSILWKIDKGLYGIPQAGRLAQKELVAHLANSGYIMSTTTPCLFSHITRPIRFVLWVDDFLIKFRHSDKADITDLIHTLELKYIIKIDWSGTSYLGMTIHHDRITKSLSISMPGYIDRMVSELQIKRTTTTINSPITYVPPKYTSEPQLELIGTTRTLTESERKFIQRIVGKLLYFAIAVDPTIELAVTRLASQQAAPTLTTLLDTNRLVEYVCQHPNPVITYRKSNMRLIIHSDASHNSETGSRSRAAAVFILGSADFKGTDVPLLPNHINGCIATLTKIIPTVCAAASESEYAALFMSGQVGEGIRQTLHDLGHQQLDATTIVYDNEISGKNSE